MERKDLKPLIEIARLNSDKELLLCKYHEIVDENLRLKQELIDIRKGKGRSYKIFATDYCRYCFFLCLLSLKDWKVYLKLSVPMLLK